MKFKLTITFLFLMIVLGASAQSDSIIFDDDFGKNFQKIFEPTFSTVDKKSVANVESSQELNYLAKTIAKKLAAKHHCEVEYTFFVHFNISNRINALTFSVKNYIEKDSGDVQKLIQNEIDFCFEEIQRNQQLDTMIKFIKIECIDKKFNLELSMPRITYDEVINNKMLVERFFDHYNKREFNLCYDLMVDTFRTQFEFSKFNAVFDTMFNHKGAIKEFNFVKYNFKEYTSDEGDGVMVDIFYDIYDEKALKEGVFTFVLENKKLNGILAFEF